MALRDVDPDKPPRHIGKTAAKVGAAAKKGKLVPLRPGQRHRTRAKKARVVTTFTEATDVLAIADKIIGADAFRLHSLAQAKTLYLFTSAEKLSGCMGGRVRTLRYPRMFRWKSGLRYDFVVLVARPQWERATDDEKTQITFHGIRHIGSDTAGRWRLDPHDVEGFFQEIEHFGLKSQDTRRIVEQLKLAGIA